MSEVNEPLLGGDDGGEGPAKARGKVVYDTELVAMHQIVEILDCIDDEARNRVVLWVASKVGCLANHGVR